MNELSIALDYVGMNTALITKWQRQDPALCLRARHNLYG